VKAYAYGVPVSPDVWIALAIAQSLQVQRPVLQLRKYVLWGRVNPLVDLYNGLELFTHLAVGLANYERQPAMYPYPKSLQYAMNRLAVIAALNQKPIPKSIYGFLTQASEPLQAWWLGDPQTTLPDEIFLYVPLWADGELHVEAQDYLLQSDIEAVQEKIEQKPIRDMLKFARQDPPQFGADYAKVRRFIVENPVIDNWTFNALDLTQPFKNGIKAIYVQASDFSSMTTYNGHYWACPHCGSLLTWRGDTPRLAAMRFVASCTQLTKVAGKFR